jgi:hypothetical protein
MHDVHNLIYINHNKSSIRMIIKGIYFLDNGFLVGFGADWCGRG